MARYKGPKKRICRRFGEPMLGNPKNFGNNSLPPGQHGATARRKTLGEYALQLKEKQKVKYMYGVLERQFRNLFERANRMKGAAGENLIRLLESRLDNTIYRLGYAPTRNGARQLVSHKHILVNGSVVNIPSYTLKPGDKISIKPSTLENKAIIARFSGKQAKINWLDFDDIKREGLFIAFPERENVPELIKEQLIVELYNK